MFSGKNSDLSLNYKGKNQDCDPIQSTSGSCHGNNSSFVYGMPEGFEELNVKEEDYLSDDKNEWVTSFLKYSNQTCSLNNSNSCIMSSKDVDFLVALFLHVFEKKQNLIILVDSAISTSVQSTESPELLFRSDSICTKIIVKEMVVTSTNYLSDLLSSTITTVCSYPGAFEIDPDKKSSCDDIHTCRKNLVTVLQLLIDKMIKDKDNVPIRLKKICCLIRIHVATKFGENAGIAATTGLFFLRLLCPAIIAPSQFNINTSTTSTANVTSEAKRGLILCAKTLQNIANRSTFGEKELFMTPLLEFSRNNQEKVAAFISDISSTLEKDDFETTKIVMPDSHHQNQNQNQAIVSSSPSSLSFFAILRKRNSNNNNNNNNKNSISRSNSNDNNNKFSSKEELSRISCTLNIPIPLEFMSK